MTLTPSRFPLFSALFLVAFVSVTPAQESGAGKSPAAGKAASSPAAKAVQSGPVTINLPEGLSKEQGDAILNELRQIRQLLEKQQSAAAQAPQPPQKASIDLGNPSHVLGNSSAPVTLVEYSDYQCPYCKSFHTGSFAELKKNFIDTGKVRFVSRDLPLDFHPFAMKASVAGLCAGDQGKFWQMRDTLISNSSALGPEAILKYAQDLSLDMKSFRACLDSDKHKTEIQKDLAEAAALNISGTPTFLLGKTSGNKLNGVVLVGAQPYATFDAAIQEALKADPSPATDSTK